MIEQREGARAATGEDVVVESVERTRATRGPHGPGQRSLVSALGGIAVSLVVALVLLGVSSDLDQPSVGITTRSLRPGTVLGSVDARDEGSDVTFEFPAGVETTTILVWDYAAEDGDWVQITLGGTPLSEPFMILHAPHAVEVPVGGAPVDVVGIKDGGGGITYAVYVPALAKGVRNATFVGGSNRFTFQRPPAQGTP